MNEASGAGPGTDGKLVGVEVEAKIRLGPGGFEIVDEALSTTMIQIADP